MADTTSNAGKGSFQECTGKGPAAERIEGCTRLLASTRGNDRTRAGYLNKRGRAYYDANRFEDAIQDFNEAIRLNPKSGEGYYNRGDAYDEKKEFDRAIADYDEAARLDPNHPPIYNNRGLAYSHKRQYDRAIRDYDQALKLKPDYPDALNNRGIARFARQDIDGAAADFERSLDLRLQNPKAFFNLGVVNYIRGNYGESVQNTTAGASFAGLDGHRAVLLYAARARAGMDTRELQQFIEQRSALDHWPILAFKLFGGKMTPEALKAQDTRGYMDQALWTCEVNYVLGLHALVKGDKNAARDHFRRSVASGADDQVPMLLFARAELKRLEAR